MPDHYDGMKLQNLIVKSMFAMGATGQLPSSISQINQIVAGHYSDYQYFTNNLTFQQLQQAAGLGDEPVAEPGLLVDERALVDDARYRHRRNAGPGRWNDPDYILIGSVGNAFNSDEPQKPTSLTPDEQYSYMSLWALMAAPLFFSGDMNTLDAFTLNVLCNHEVIDLDRGSHVQRERRGHVRHGIWILEQNGVRREVEKPAQPRQSIPTTRTPLGKSGAASSIQSLLARLPWMKATVTSPFPHSRQPRLTSPACTLGICCLLVWLAVQPGLEALPGRVRMALPAKDGW